MKKFLCSLAGTLALGLSFPASAGVYFSISDLSDVDFVSTSGFGGTPDVDLSDGLVGSDAFLNVGETWEFDFFSIALPLIGYGTGTVNASLAFEAPSTAPVATGSGSGSYASFFVSAGDLTWTSQPGSFSLLDGTTYSVLFENLSGVTWGRSVDVRAYLTLDSEAQSVPEPGTMLLLGLGMIGVMLASRRQLAARRA